ncbi:MAG TPA: nucleotide sugar dehydrogenase, partial [Polyangia bacterium]|nr:nucleotide sugar dehydrogenase [Polyangia bacterium]
MPLALALADKGHQVCVHDIDERAIAQIRAGKMPFLEANAEPLLARVLAERRFELTADPASIADCEIAILIIGTPVDEHLNPKFRVIKETLDTLYPHFRDGQILILRSTVFPGISEKVQSYFNDRGKRISVCFCPERIAEGAALHEYATLPQIVSGFAPDATATAAALFADLTAEVLTLAPLEAELTKLFTNPYRYIKFSIANQFFQIANDYGLDFYKIHHAMTYNYPRAKDFPTPGFAAGPCLFKDTMQLAAF